VTAREPVIDVRDVFRIYGTGERESVALQGLTLSVAAGELVVVLGPSGSGKSTLLRLLAGFDRPTAGVARVLGLEPGRLSPRSAAAYRARSLGMVDQHYARALSPDLTCRSTVELQLALLGIAPDERRRRAEDMLQWAGLRDRADDLPSALSGGEQQRVAVCAAIAHGPALLLADEPAGELDATNAEHLYRTLGELVRQTGATALIVSHDRASLDVADRVVHIRDGRLSQETLGGTDALVVARGGWVRLPEAMLAEAGVDSHVEAAAGPEGIILSPAGPARPVPIRPEVAAVRHPAPGPSEAAALVRGVSVAYGEGRALRVVLEGMDASFAAARLTAVTGRSGSGKSTLLDLLAGLQSPDAGTVEVAGIELGPLSRAERAAFRREHVALVRQEPGLVPFLSATENVALSLTVRGIGVTEATGQARAWLERVGLERRLDERASALSAGERQRVAVARALAAGPRLLLADEPTARLDEDNARAVADLFVRAAHDHGTAVVCATHDAAVSERADAELALEHQGESSYGKSVSTSAPSSVTSTMSSSRQPPYPRR
jgi:ABC-type lipoprotein export system ATPase subunit